MPPRRTASESLTPDDLTILAAALADGKQPTVYLRDGTPSLDLPAGASARVLSISGTTLTLKPRGVDDELPYEADELRMTRNAPPPTEKPKRAARTPAAPASAAPKSADSKPADPKPAGPKPATPKPSRRPSSTKPPTSVTVTIFGSADNKWSVTVTRGGRKPARSRAVPTSAVDAAMAGLADQAAIDATSSVLHAARDEAQQRVDQLSRELAAAQAALANLT